MQLPVPADLAGSQSSGGVVLAQELLMELGWQLPQDLDRIIRVNLVHRLGTHIYAGYQRGARQQGTRP